MTREKTYILRAFAKAIATDRKSIERITVESMRMATRHGAVMHAMGLAAGLMYANVIDAMTFCKITQWIQSW